MGRATQGLPRLGICTRAQSDPRTIVSPSSVCLPPKAYKYVSCWEEKRRSLAFSDTHLGPLSHSLDICTLVPDTAEVRDQQDIARIPEAHFGKKSGLAKANRSPGLGQEAAFQLLGALHLQESNQVSASTPTQEDLVPGVTSQGPSVPAGPLMMQSHLTPQK